MLLQADEDYRIIHGDCIEHMHTMPRHCVDFSVYSPPFPAVYSYTSEACDLGNSEDDAAMKLHFGFFFRAIFPLIKPGRVMVVHCQQIVRQKRTGKTGMFDFRGLLIRLAQRAGFVYEYDWLIPKAAQAQAIRTKSRELQFAGLESDRARCRGAMGDYLVKFRAPGENKVPINSEGEVSRNEWIEWAEGYWPGIRENDTLNKDQARHRDDTRHIAPLQLSVINRLVRLYSNPGEIVFSPFAGMGSEIYTALKLNRRGYGFELKDSYYAAAIANCERVVASREEQLTLQFD